MTDEWQVPNEIPPELVLKIATTILRAYYRRERTNLDEIIQALDELSLKRLAWHWSGLKEKCASHEEALAYLTEWIASELDGGKIPLHKQTKD